MQSRYETLQQLMDSMENMAIAQIRELAREFGIVPRTLHREEIVQKIIAVYNGELQPERRLKSGRPTKRSLLLDQLADETQISSKQIADGSIDNVDKSLPRQGIVEVTPDGDGYVRVCNYSPSKGKDYYLSSSVISRMQLQSGDKIKFLLRQYSNRDIPSVVYVKEINDQSYSQINRTPFDSFEPCFPNERIILDSDQSDYSLRALSLVAPIGKGQRGLIVAPPKTGKTILLKKIAMAVRKNNPDIHLVVLLIDQRPEEITDFQDSVDCQVAYSTFDQSPQNHLRIAELVFANARRRVEQGQDVMVLLDSITKLCRAYNQVAKQSCQVSYQGLDIASLQEPKRMFGLGRNTKQGGSLTILATALVDTGSPIDDAIYEEFKDTCNMEILLDRHLSEKRIFPAINLNHSGTRREELLLNQNQLEGMHIARRLLAGEDSVTATENLLEIIMTTENNDQTIETLKALVKNAQARRKTQNA